MSGILRTARALLAIVAPTTGVQSTGTVTVCSTAGTPTLPKNSYGVPIIGSALAHDHLIKTTADAVLSTSGVAVPVKSVLGGAGVNLAASTKIRWSPALPGVEAVSLVAAPGLTGGTQLTTFAAVQQARIYEQIGAGNAQRDLFAAKLGRYPALVLMWGASADGDRVARRRALFLEDWTFAIVASRLDNDDERRGEALQIMEDVTDLILGRDNVDGECISAPQPLLVTGRRRIVATESAYIYGVNFTTQSTVEGVNPKAYADLARFRLDLSTPDTIPLPVVVDDLIPNT